MEPRRIRILVLAFALLGAWPIARANAQTADGGAPPEASAPVPAADAGSTGDNGAASAPPTPPALPPSVEPPPPAQSAPAVANVVAQKKPKRAKPLQMTVGMAPTATDFGSEADLVSIADVPFDAPKQSKWTYTMRGFLRAPMLVGMGPRNNGVDVHELHAPPRDPRSQHRRLELRWPSTEPHRFARFRNVSNANVGET